MPSITKYVESLLDKVVFAKYNDLLTLKQELWLSRYELLRRKKSRPWTIDQIKFAILSLKNNKTRDPHGWLNETFKDCCPRVNSPPTITNNSPPKIGQEESNDLIVSIYHLMNGIKDSFHIPKFMMYENITSLFKNKGSRLKLENDRGIFILPVLKKILDKLIYFDYYESINKNMSDSNIGARKHQNVRNHLFVIYGIINSVVKNKTEGIHLQIYDLVKAFDKIWLEDSCNELFETIDDEKDDKLALLYKSNEKNLVMVKTPVGNTKRVNIERIVQQGGTWGPLKCSNTIDKIGKESKKRVEL